MFRPNKRSQEPALGSTVHALPGKVRRRLENSWAGTFRRQCFSRIKEEPFAVLYADTASRPNTPVNVLVGLDILKAGFGWSDEELYDHVLFDLQTRYALGYNSLDDGSFEARTLYHFRHRLSRYNLAHGVNLLQQAFADMTDQQIAALAVATRQQRMEQSDVVLREQQVTLIQTAIAGHKPSANKLHLADFAITQDAQGAPLMLTCPQGQGVPVTTALTAQRFLVHFPATTCALCPLYVAGSCPPQPGHRRQSFRLSFTQADVDKAQRHRRSRAACADGHNLRAAIEATIRSVKHAFPASKLPVRGLFRVTCLIIAAAAMTNVRRIQRYLADLRRTAARGVVCPA